MVIRDQRYLLYMLKALADESRLKLLHWMREGEYTVGDLAARLELTEPTVSHHLSKLREAGLVTLTMAGNQRFYRINEHKLAEFKQLVAEIERLPPVPERVVSDNRWIDALDWDEADKQVLRDYTVNGRLRSLPVKKQKKTLVVLRWVATLFEPGRLYTEPEVNAVLKSVYEPDFVSLRRDLIDFGYLRRELGGGKYWRTVASDTPADENTQE
jgi:DNA-binding transcriptional ArsR family regulator